MNSFVFSLLMGVCLWPDLVQAASFEGSVQAVVSGIIQILQMVAMGYLAKIAYDYVRSRPDATDRLPATLFGLVALLGIQAVWTWLQAKIR